MLDGLSLWDGGGGGARRLSIFSHVRRRLRVSLVEVACTLVSIAVRFRRAWMHCHGTFMSLVWVMQPRDIHAVNVLHTGWASSQIGPKGPYAQVIIRLAGAILTTLTVNMGRANSESRIECAAQPRSGQWQDGNKVWMSCGYSYITATPLNQRHSPSRIR